MAGKTSKKSTNVANKAAAKPVLLSGGNPQIAKADGDPPCRPISRPRQAGKAITPSLRRGLITAPLPRKQSVPLLIQQSVPHGPDHDLLLRAKTQLALDAVEAVPDGHRLDPPGLRNRAV